MKLPLPYSPRHIADLAELHQAFAVDVVLIGAGALMGFIEFDHRITEDLDVVVSVGVAELGSTLGGMTGWRQDPKQEQRWWSPRGLKYDILPAGAGVLTSQEIVWPSTKMVMRATGLDLAFRHREATPLAGIFIALPAAVCVLKMIAFQDRPYERKRDIGDIVAVMRSLSTGEDDRLFEEPFVSAGLPFAAGSAFLLGRVISNILTPETAPLVDSFVLQLEREGSAARTSFVREFGMLDEEEAEKRASGYWNALRLGLGAGKP